MRWLILTVLMAGCTIPAWPTHEAAAPKRPPQNEEEMLDALFYNGDHYTEPPEGWARARYNCLHGRAMGT